MSVTGFSLNKKPRITIEENLYGKNVHDLQELYDFAEEIKRRTLGLVKPQA